MRSPRSALVGVWRADRRPIRGGRRLQARLDYLDHGRHRSSRGGDHPHGDRYAEPWKNPPIIAIAGDQYFVPDSSRSYFDDLPGEKYLRCVPNTKPFAEAARTRGRASPPSMTHSCSGAPNPRFSWRFEKNGAIRVTTVAADHFVLARVDKPAVAAQHFSSN